MSDLEGERAFEIVLDRLVDVERASHSAGEKCGDAEGKLREFERKYQKLKAVVAKAKNLFEAADCVVDATPESLLEKMTALRAQIELCQTDLSTIPF